MKNLILRSISGLIYIALIIGTLIYSNAAFMFLCMAFGIFSVTELSKISSKSSGFSISACGMDVFGIICLTCLAIPISFFSISSIIISGIIGFLYLLYFIARLCGAIYMKDSNATESVAYSFFGQMYIGIGLVSAELLSIMSPGLVLLAFMLIWINDTGAFLVGSAIGKHPLCPRLSPKKSWEGFFGGLGLCIITSLVLAFTGYSKVLFDMDSPNVIFTGIILPLFVCIFATLGDLFESMIKRHAGVKDSGKLIPGHGGILDRIDSMLLVMPAVCLIIIVFSVFNVQL